MALWRWTGRQFERASLRNLAAGCDAYVCCPGPSLKDAAGLLADPIPGAVRIVVNTAYPAIAPDLWIGGDSPECYNGGLMTQPFGKLLGNRYAEMPWLGRRAKAFPNTYFMDRRSDGRMDAPGNGFNPKRLGADIRFVWAWTFWTALHLAAWLGCRRLFLVGVDLGGTGNQDGRGARPTKQADYHDGRRLDDRLRRINETGMRIQLEWMPQLRRAAEANGYEVVVTGEHSAARAHLPYVPLTDALADTAARQPRTAGLARVHALLANQGSWRWKLSKSDERCGVLTGADRKTEKALPQWYWSLRLHYGGAVAFGDFGLSERMRKWCERRGEVVNCKGSYLPGWFNKPIALLNSPFERTAWLDTDCEVLGSVDELLTMALGEAGYAAAADGHNPADAAGPCGGTPVNTGVLAVEHGCPAIKTWARKLLADPSGYRGDQDCLNALIAAGEAPAPTELSERFNRLRLSGPQEGDTAVYHWTGPAGHAWLKRYGVTAQGRAGELVKRLPKSTPLRVAEIGVLDGRTSRHLLRMRPLLHLTMVDLWGAVPVDCEGLSGRQTLDTGERNRHEALAVTEFAAGRRTVLRGDSAEMAATLADASLDLVFIDADHSYGGCLRDVTAWAPKVRPGGMIAGHDWENPDFPQWGVRRAVEEWCEAAGVDPATVETAGDCTWFLRLPVAAAEQDEQGAPEAAGAAV